MAIALTTRQGRAGSAGSPFSQYQEASFAGDVATTSFTAASPSARARAAVLEPPFDSMIADARL